MIYLIAVNIYYVYILTNYNKTVLYAGVTNNLKTRLNQHKTEKGSSFTKRYKCYYLIYWEEYNDIRKAIEREKEIKGWKRFKKEDLINGQNPNWTFKNELIINN